MYFCECLNDNNLPSTPIHETIKLASLDDVERIMQLRGNIAEFPVVNESEKILRQALKTNTGRTYYIEKDGAIIASASTSAENSLSAMVVGVCTHRIIAEMVTLHSYYKNDPRLYERRPNTLFIL